jgi:hypothetical protein
VAVEDHQKQTSQPFLLAAGTPAKLADVAEYSGVSSSMELQSLIALAHDAIVLREPIADKPFARAVVPRVLELASRKNHPSKEERTCYVMTLDYVDALRKLRVALELPRRDLVVEYLVQAAWEALGGGTPGGGRRKKPGVLSAGRRLASYHNVDSSRAAPTDGASLLQLPLKGLEVKPKT